MKFKAKNSTGITLIALIITIIILLILAGISIASLTQTGLFKKAKEAKQNTIDAQLKENTILNEYGDSIELYVKEIDSIDDMLKIAKISDNYTIEQISSNYNNVLDKILAVNKNIDYIIKNKDDWKDKICNNENGMKSLVSNKKAIYKAMNDEEWRKEILLSEYSNILDENAIKVPNMTSNTSIMGNAFASYEYEPAYKAFLGYSAGDKGWNSTKGPDPMYIGFDFKRKVMIYKVCVEGHYNWLFDNWKVQAYSNENNEWYNISNNYKMTVNFSEVPLINYAVSSKFRLIRQQTPTIICRLQFYCIDTEDL